MNVKKLLSILTMVAVVIAFFFNFSNTVQAAPVKKKVTVTIGKYTIKLNNKKQNTQTLTYGSTTYIPINSVAYLTGAKVKKSQSTYNFVPLTEQGITKDIEAEYEAKLKKSKSIKKLTKLFLRIDSLRKAQYDQLIMAGTIESEISNGKNLYLRNLDSYIDNFNSTYQRHRKEIVETINSIKEISESEQIKFNNQLSAFLRNYDSSHNKVQQLFQMLKTAKETGNSLDSDFSTQYIDINADLAGASYNIERGLVTLTGQLP